MQRYEAYRDSGVEWIGEVPEGWEIRRLKTLAVNDIRKTPTNQGAYIGLENIQPWTQRFLESAECSNDPEGNYYDEDCVLFGKLRPYLAKVFVPTESGQCSSEFLILRSELLSLRYLSYSLINGRFIDEVNSLTYGAKMPRASWETIGSIPSPLPSAREQAAIADYLDEKTAEIDSIVSQTERSIELLREYRKSVISEAVTKGLDPDAPMKDSSVEWIGEIPAGWEIVKSRYVIEDITDIDHWMPDSVDAGYPYVAISDLKPRSSLIAFTDCKQISKSDFQKLSLKSMPRKGDVILARYATIGTSCLVDSDEPFVVSYSCVTVTPRDERLDGRYFDYWLKSEPCGRELDRFTKSNTQGNVGKESLFQMKMILPPMSTQRRIADYLDAKTAEIDSLIADKQRQVELLKEYRKSLISEAVTGKFKVPGLE